MLKDLRQTWISLRKTANDFVDLFRPKNSVELLFFYANGPKKGELHKRLKGRNVVTSFQVSGGAAPTSGRDIMRRLLCPPELNSVAVVGSLTARDSAGALTGVYVQKMELGSGLVGEDASDAALDSGIVSTRKDITSVTFDTSDTNITFIADWDPTEANYTLSEIALLSGRQQGGVYDFLARKTFSSFTKTSDFTLQIKWTLRF